MENIRASIKIPGFSLSSYKSTLEFEYYLVVTQILSDDLDFLEILSTLLVIPIHPIKQ